MHIYVVCKPSRLVLRGLRVLACLGAAAVTAVVAACERAPIF